MNTLSYKLRASEGDNGLSRHFQAYIAGLVLEGGSDIVGIPVCLFVMNAFIINTPFYKGRWQHIDMHTGV